MPHIYSEKLKSVPFIQKGIAFDNLIDVGVIIESYRILEYILEKNDGFSIVSSYHLDYDWLIIKKDEIRFGVAVSQGAPMVVDLAERYLSSGAKAVVRIGTTGSLVSGLTLGDYSVPYAAIKDDGTSKFYLSKGAPAIADISLANKISASLRTAGHTVHNGITWSTDGRWKETDEMVKQYVHDGAIVADMESSSLFAFGLNKKTSVASISLLSDEIHSAEGEEFKGLSNEDIWFQKVLPGCDSAFHILLQVFSKEK